MDENEPKQILHYTLAEKIGEGRNGEVYRAWDAAQSRWIALKLLRPELTDDFTFQKQVIAKTRAVTQLAHPNIATVSAIEVVEGRYVIASELIKGRTLTDVFSAEPLDCRRFVEMATQAAEGLNAAHSRMIVHGNLRGSNVLVSEGGTVKLLDFGLASDLSWEETTMTPAAIAYLSPEQLNEHAPNFVSDLYSLGVVLFEALAGQLPFSGSDVRLMANAIRHHPRDMALLQQRGLPGELILLIEKLIARQPGDRFANASELLVTLNAIKDFERSSPQDVRPTGRQTSPRQYLLVSFLIALLVVLWSIIAAHYK
jgi:serine/threonine protein kinase